MWTLNVQCLDKSKFTVTVEPDATVTNLRQQVCVIKKCDQTSCNLIYAGTVLSDNDKKLCDYNIKNNITIILLIKKTTKPVVAKVEEKEVKEEVEDNKSHDTNDTNDSEECYHNEDEGQYMYSGDGQNYEEEMNDMMQQINAHPEEFVNFMMGDPALNQIVENNPQINNLIQNNPQGFIQILQNMGLSVGQQLNVDLDDDEKKDIDEIMQMGIGSYESVVQYYRAYEKNKDAVVNALLNDL